MSVYEATPGGARRPLAGLWPDAAYSPRTSRSRGSLREAVGPKPRAVASGANSAASQAPDATAATPGEVAEEQQFTLDDVAEFDDGLMIEIAGTVADKASKTDRGAEATNGQIVIASIRIENKTQEALRRRERPDRRQVRRGQGCADHHRQDRRAAKRLQRKDQAQG